MFSSLAQIAAAIWIEKFSISTLASLQVVYKADDWHQVLKVASYYTAPPTIIQLGARSESLISKV